MSPLVQLVGGHHPISLDEAVDGAAMLTRTDRKYVVGPDQLAAAVAGLRDGVRVLEIEGHRAFPYRTVYFDTPDLVSYMGAARSRPQRFKVRTRTYVDSGTCWLEVKVRNGRDQTVKHRMEYRVDDAEVLTADGRAFVAELVDLPGVGRELRATLATAYTRTTFVVDAMRMTVDADLVCTHADGRSVGAPDLLVWRPRAPGPPPRWTVRCGRKACAPCRSASTPSGWHCWTPPFPPTSGRGCCAASAAPL